jgi:hypothetical protein
MKSIFRVLDRSVPLKVALWRHRMFVFLGNFPFLVYTMGKVGSSTVVHSLRRAKISRLVYHVHFFSHDQLDHIEKKYERFGQSTAAGVKLSKLFSGNLGHLTSSHMLSQIELGKTFVVSLVRDPIDTFFSHVFQNPKIHRPFLLGNDGILCKDAVERYVNEHFSNFDGRRGDYISNWFDDEFLNYCRIDVYAHPFDHDNGYCIIRKGSWNVAVLALENLDVSLSKAISELIGKPINIDIVSTNRRESSRDAELYREIKGSVRIPADCIHKVYSTKYAQHFFSPKHVDLAMKKWRK